MVIRYPSNDRFNQTKQCNISNNKLERVQKFEKVHLFNCIIVESHKGNSFVEHFTMHNFKVHKLKKCDNLPFVKCLY